MRAIVTNRPLRVAASLAVIALAGALAPRASQAQTITACSASKSGSMYRVGVTGAPGDCTSATHTKATWNVQGPKGDTGAPGLSGHVVHTLQANVAPGSGAIVEATCPGGKRVLGGGYSANNSALTVRVSYPSTPTNWYVRASNAGAQPVVLTVYAICATVAP